MNAANKKVVRLEINVPASAAISVIAICGTIYYIWRYTWNRCSKVGLSDEELRNQIIYEESKNK